MHFSTSAAPTLTPLGVRLLNVSHHKLGALEPSIGGRDGNDLLRRGVLVREALRAAWATIDSPESELTDWRAPDALGLSVLSEEEEEDEEMAEERWLDDVLSDIEEPAWAETTVSTPSSDDMDEDCVSCDYDAFEIAHIESVQLDDNYDVVVQVAAVDEDDDEEDAVVATAWFELPRKAAAEVVFCDELPAPAPVAAKVVQVAAPDPSNLHRALSQVVLKPDECDEVEELPALQGCALDDDDEDEEDDCCRTPPLLSCEDLEEISEDALWRRASSQRSTGDAKSNERVEEHWRILRPPCTPCLSTVLLPG